MFKTWIRIYRVIYAFYSKEGYRYKEIKNRYHVKKIDALQLKQVTEGFNSPKEKWQKNL